MTDGEQLLGLPGPAPRFATVFRGYDRQQVDSWLAEHERPTAEPANPLAEAANRERALESRLSELEHSVPESPLPDSLAASVLDQARDVARQLPERVVRDAEAERKTLQRGAAKAIETAHERSAQIVQAARRQHDEAAATLHEARSKIDRYRQHASDTARDRVHRTWEETAAGLARSELELAGLRTRRDIILTELAQLEESIARSRANLREHRAAELEVGDPSDPGDRYDDPDDTNEIETVMPVDAVAEVDQEHPRWALMPIEW